MKIEECNMCYAEEWCNDEKYEYVCSRCMIINQKNENNTEKLKTYGLFFVNYYSHEIFLASSKSREKLISICKVRHIFDQYDEILIEGQDDSIIDNLSDNGDYYYLIKEIEVL